MSKKKVRMLLRPNATPTLDEDGKLDIQRKTLSEYVAKHPDWILDSKEYLAKKCTDRIEMPGTTIEVSSEALEDAEHGEYNILVALGLSEIIGVSFMISLILYGVKIYTVREGLCDLFDDNF